MLVTRGGADHDVALNASPSHSRQITKEQICTGTTSAQTAGSQTRNVNEKRRKYLKRETERFKRSHNWESKGAGNKGTQTRKPETMNNHYRQRTVLNRSQETSHGSQLKHQQGGSQQSQSGKPGGETRQKLITPHRQSSRGTPAKQEERQPKRESSKVECQESEQKCN